MCKINFIVFVYYSLLINQIFVFKTVFSYEKLKPRHIFKYISNEIFFIYYTGPTVNDYIRIPYEDSLSIPELANFNKTTKTVLYFHGWTEEPSKHEESIDTIVAAFLKKNSTNLIVLEYSKLVQGDSIFHYIKATQNATDIGQAVAYFLHKFIPKYQTAEQVHLISHSLGSQIMSRTANFYGKGKLKWLTALDPAGPLFNIPIIDHLTKEDGEFVDVIHTDGYYYGDGRSIGHVDFFPNLGMRTQPYCSVHSYDFCDHHMSWRYYAESILNENAFLAKQCDFTLFCNRFNMLYCCDKYAPITIMGYNINKTLRGDFYLKTRNESPYDLSTDGFYV